MGARVGAQPGGGAHDRGRTPTARSRCRRRPRWCSPITEHPAFGMGMFHRLPQTMQALEHVRESFRTGVGHDYDSHGPQGAVGIERSFEPWNRRHPAARRCCPRSTAWSPSCEAGAPVADVGCGAGSAVLLMAQAFPHSTFTGLRHLAVRARRGQRTKLDASGPRQRRVPRPAQPARCPRTARSTSYAPSTASTT